MSPIKIMFIRHAEKPVPGGAPGVAPDGSPDPESLSPVGWERAQKLVAFFSRPTASHIGKPDKVFAAAPDTGSKRPYETALPLAEALWPAPERSRSFDATIRKDKIEQLASALVAEAGVVLVAWEHTLLAAAVAALPNAPPTPAKWPGDRFDVVWILEAKADGWDFQQTPQKLMPGDQDTVIPFSDGA